MSEPLPLVPAPASVRLTGGVYELPHAARVAHPADRPLAELASEWLGLADAGGECLELRLAPHAGDDAAYRLEITTTGISLEASSRAGLVHGLQTLRQLLGPPGGSRRLPCVVLADRPAYVWRGAHLDCCRHFMSVAFVKRYIDLLALLKLDRFHWHLTEDQGWRLVPVARMYQMLPKRKTIPQRRTLLGIEEGQTVRNQEIRTGASGRPTVAPGGDEERVVGPGGAPLEVNAPASAGQPQHVFHGVSEDDLRTQAGPADVRFEGFCDHAGLRAIAGALSAAPIDAALGFRSVEETRCDRVALLETVEGTPHSDRARQAATPLGPAPITQTLGNGTDWLKAPSAARAIGPGGSQIRINRYYILDNPDCRSIVNPLIFTTKSCAIM